MPDTATVQIAMPGMGESVTEGIVLEWHVAEGDSVSEGDTVVEVSTDKVDAEVPAPADGVITRILAQVDDEIAVGAPLAEMEAGEGPSASPAGPVAAGDPPPLPVAKASSGGVPPTAPPAGEASGSDESSGDGNGTAGEKLVIAMPEMGESVTEGVVLEWHVAEGDAVSEGDTVVEVSTDKVDAEVPAPASGLITKLLAQVDDEVKVGQPLAEMETSAGAASPAGDAVGGPTPEEALATGGGGGSPAAAGPAGNGAPSADVRATPVARRVAAANGVDLTSVQGTGPGSKVTKEDVLNAGNGASAAPALAGAEKQLRGPAAMLAKAMDESRAVPTATSFRTIAVDTLDAKRRAINPLLKERGLKVSFTHLIAWAIVQATREFPVMVRVFEQRDGKPYAIENGPVNLGIAVDVERKDGSHSLMVPAIKNAQDLDFGSFHSHYEELIAKTRENKLTADDFQGTNISLTNPGGIGTVASVPRLLAGQSAIVATGSIAYPPEWAHASPDRLKQLGVSKVMTMTSTYDHRVIQGAESGAFLRRVEQLLQGEDGFYESVAADLGIDAGPVAAAHPASASAPPLGAPGASAEPSTAPGQVDEELLQAVQAATSILKAYRTHGHLAAQLDPLGSEPKGDPALQPENVNLTPELMSRIPASILRVGVPGETLLEALPRLRTAYCGTIGYQFEHLSSHQQRIWLREMIETGAHRQPLSGEEKKRLLDRLIDVFEFERFLERAYLGQKMFSIEGLDVIVPMLDELVTLAHRAGAEEVVFGMAHRGRLSVLAHNLGRSVQSILAEFEGSKRLEAVKAVAAIPHGGTGDVKYHYGHRGIYETSEGEKISVRLYPNPSHLEFVDPVVTGGARYLQSEFDGPTINQDTARAVPVLLHGDAAFPAQGVVAETFNLQALKGYTTGGTVHIIQNNQVGFTTDPDEARSTPFAADMAKGYNVPIVHVNADDVEACSAAIRLAMAYRERWGRDIVIDVIGYRRFGHNETDEPAYTQPTMAAKIKAHRPVSEIYAEQLMKEGTVSAEAAGQAGERRREEMAAALKELRRKMEAGEYEDPTVTGATTSTGELLDRTASPPVDTAVPAARLRGLNGELLRTPEGFNVHRKLRRPLARRTETLEQGGIDFGHAEALAFGSLLTEGVHIRLTGQDTERGTFSHRHLVLHDENTGLEYTPMQHLQDASAPFELYNSPLSETACLGFEYGYSTATPNALVLWEAQFGDFANAAQVIIDSFIVSGESKWGQSSRLTLLLPHGYEGSGPEHSSARIERFLALGAEGNVRIAYPTTAAQYFHLLRRQALIRKPRPLIVFTPKGLLRLDRATADIEQLTGEHFHFILDDTRTAARREKVERLVLCTGKVYFDIDASERREAAENVAIARVEMLYPFAKEQLQGVIASYPNLKEIAWVQEEPRNMGAWKVMSRRLPDVLPEGVALTYIGRPGRASTGEGYSGAHAREQERIILTALTPGA
ncbi:MAG TPA: multifunctional oxoglutarate decarboxylase/oxoglutarate dehydrogenase thiamine pyrophosphate-binding subunit/dihydrolipoyllysine-residue succinyltransferase subunit [Solirubrobacterales bacterium]|jgi:2-oxoglutarate dehydrogenase E1 component|nr:multifunctional oxoglutarate decarboxylase/oxoglutarate dehydrogenase thiamine pyrophosphate-binding subunit/dihydrolipoyllysine-residue succinyltransferase subunit [Solirubrobacterales bacterium]